MLRILYAVIIAPLELVMRSVLSWGYDITASYGLAIVILSLVVNTAILPIYNKAESWQEEERAIKKKMERTERMIEKNFSGQEKFAMLSTLRRQHGYCTRLALRSSVGFFLQIPFFFAAYHLLSNFEGIRGVALGPIADLGAPDALLQFGSFEIHLLPIIMTVVNLASAFVYSNALSRKDKIQLYGLAGLFLVLLYQSPAALTLYWTLNNIYSFGKNIVEKTWLPAWEKSHGQSFLSSIGNICTKNLAQGGIRARYFGVASLVVFILAAVDGVWAWESDDMGKLVPEGSLHVFLIAIWASALLGAWAAFKANQDTKKYSSGLRWFLALIQVFSFVVLGINMLSGCLEQWYDIIKVPPMTVLLGAILAVISALSSILLWVSEKPVNQKNTSANQLWDALSYLWSAMTFIGIPFLVYWSDPLSVPGGWRRFIPYAMVTFIVSSVFLVGLRTMLNQGVMRYMTPVLSTFFVVGVVYAFVFVGDYGLLMDGEFQNTTPLFDKSYRWWDSGILVACIAFTWLVLRYFSWKKIANFMLFLVVATVGVGAWAVSSSPQFGSVEKSAIPTKPAYADAMYAFSAKHPNLVTVVFDMFTADHFPKILEENPELAKKLEGFVWYRDTLSVGSGTGFGLPAATGGNRYSVRNINADNENKPYIRHYGEAYTLIPNLLGKEWNSAVSGWVWEPKLRMFHQKPQAVVSHYDLMEDWYAYYYANSIGGEKAEQMTTVMRLYSLALFKRTPMSLRKNIYRKGAWLVPGQKNLFGPKGFAPLRALAEETHVVDQQGPTYRYFYFESTHSGFLFTPDGQPATQKSVPPEGWKRAHPHFDYNHYLAAKANLQEFARWLDHLKALGIYDQTRIVVVSDHGGHDTHALIEVLGRVPMNGRLDNANYNPGLRYPLLLSKDFSARSRVQISDARMTNGDGLDLLLEGVISVPRKYLGDYKNPNRVRWYNSTNDWGFEKKHLPTYTYEVQGSMFDKNAWRLESREWK